MRVGHVCGCCCGWCVGGCVRKWWVGVLAVERLTCCAPFACVLPPVFAVLLLLLLLPVGVSGAAALGCHGYCSGGVLPWVLPGDCPVCLYGDTALGGPGNCRA